MSQLVIPDTLADVLEREREGIVETALAAIRHVRPRHYELAGGEETHDRLERLYDHVLFAITRRNLGPIVEYAQRLATERYERGYALAELQAVFNALEEALWDRLVADLPPAEIADGLTLLSAVFGVAKDTLACAFVAAASVHRAPALDLESLTRAVA